MHDTFDAKPKQEAFVDKLYKFKLLYILKDSISVHIFPKAAYIKPSLGL